MDSHLACALALLMAAATFHFQRAGAQTADEPGILTPPLFNPGRESAKVTIAWSTLGLEGTQQVRDLWRQKDLGTYSGTFAAEVRPHGVVLVRMTPAPASGNDVGGR